MFRILNTSKDQYHFNINKRRFPFAFSSLQQEREAVWTKTNILPGQHMRRRQFTLEKCL